MSEVRPGVPGDGDRGVGGGGFVPVRERVFRRVLAGMLKECRSVLDVGCGAVTPLSRIEGIELAIGVDIAQSALESARRLGFHHGLVRADVSQLAGVFAERSFDAVVALDVIEHLDRERALDSLAAFERIARRKVVVLTPNGFVAQSGTRENPFQEHRSGFSVSDLEARGFRVRGVYGLRGLLGAYGEVVLRPRVLWRRINDLAAPLVYRAPELAFSLLAEKTLA